MVERSVLVAQAEELSGERVCGSLVRGIVGQALEQIRGANDGKLRESNGKSNDGKSSRRSFGSAPLRSASVMRPQDERMSVRSRGNRCLGSPDDNFLQLLPSSNRHKDDNICLSKRGKHGPQRRLPP
jgi:hypothetical protein